MNVLEAVDLYRFYHSGEEETLALRGVSLHVQTGEIVAVMGPSGSGKSTLLSCLAGLDEPDGGHVVLMGKRLTHKPESVRAAMRAAEIGILLQSRNLFEHLSVIENMRLQMHLARKFDRQRLDSLIDLVGLTHRRHARPSQLSGGEAARAGLAVALSTNPHVLLADEPTGEVDAETEQDIVRLFTSLRQQGGATLIVTHSDELAAQADRIVRLLDGRVING
ncbi:ABC transporter ATP-binding protein [Ktedonobacter racemifer]|uniref:ABC transporter related protein n=1 Tax=Ktedonobacter racemifer DSM 44963 TaxID=485913 RepID=D6TWF8_KTERA|nr:ABC transporter ATP-binding protein [Ktedonobacter racemifer]EFH84541.1 ABC transporter related protein [Ktedonobacter racemifer DSM 44963]